VKLSSLKRSYRGVNKMIDALAAYPTKYIQPYRDYEFYDFIVNLDASLRTAVMTDYRTGCYPYHANYNDHSKLYPVLAQYGACFPIDELLWEP